MIPHNSTNWIGIDVSKRQLDLASLLPITKLPKTLPNTPQGHQKLLRILSSQPDSKVIFESTGGYEQRLFQALSDQGIHASRINPLHARCFARATGLLAKTDQLDAQIFVKYGEALQPEATAPIDPDRQQLQDLLKYRQQLYDQLHREKMQLEHEHGKTVSRMIKTRIKSLEKQITQLAQEAEEMAKKRTNPWPPPRDLDRGERGGRPNGSFPFSCHAGTGASDSQASGRPCWGCSHELRQRNDARAASGQRRSSRGPQGPLHGKPQRRTP